MNQSNTILLVTKDLFFVPTIQSAAQKHGFRLVTALSFDSKKVLELVADSVLVVIVDLSSQLVAEIPSVLGSLRDRFPKAVRVAFGPHVQEQRLGAAHEAGCEVVLTRGQLSSQIEQRLLSWTQG